MNEAEFLELSKNFKASRERLSQLPKLIDDLTVKELNLRRDAIVSRRNDLSEEIEKIKKEREKLQSEMLERKALIPILRKQLVEASKQIWNTKTKDEAERIDELKEKIKETKLLLEDSINKIIKSAALLWGVDQIQSKLMECLTHRIRANMGHSSDLPRKGMEEQLLEMTEQYKKDQETLRLILEVSTEDNFSKLFSNTTSSG
ncbi:TPA: hypothetical protein ENX78_07500 [Candidatus Poribacteria bacterium]|nr:hypothetical protein [Candidatus Poribacteria bacterium]